MRRLATVVGAVEAAILVGWLVFAVVRLARGASPGDVGMDGLFVMLAVTAGVGWLLASRVPDNSVGWLLLAIAGFFLLAAPVFVTGYLLEDRYPDVAAWFFWYSGDESWVWLPPIMLLFLQVPLRFPDGGLPTPRWRWFSRFTLTAIVTGSFVMATAPTEVRPGIDNPLSLPWSDQALAVAVTVVGSALIVGFVGSIASVVVRYRRADLATRTQIRWFAWAVAAVIVFYVLSFFVPGESLNGWVSLSYALIPASIGVAVLRYRLYDIDRVVSRTTSYAVVTAMVVGVYLVLVASLSRLLPGSSSFAVAIGTLAAAAAFRPLLTSVQRRVDHRFNRSQYDAGRAVEEFASRLRNEVDTDTVVSDLVRVVALTVQPDQASVWVSARRVTDQQVV
ncbi:MAG: hypothetical protein OEV62_03625 [Actinomycetota bacterium]|nr:hypothetical protein [Actinomycetota bacterium]MDH4353402.1 hypothetical protein [Actinomycetota bacterium]